VKIHKTICLATAVLLAYAAPVVAEETIKVGVLHSLSGTMAISETTLKDTVLMLIEEQNKKGGVLGKKLEAVVVDPASDWPLFALVLNRVEESSKNVFYTGAAPNQQAIPAVDYLMDDVEVERWVLAGTDYVYPRTTNKILEAYLKDKGVAAEDIMINYTPFGHSDWQSIVSDIKKFGGAGKKTAVVSTINGDANVPFYKELGNQGVSAEDIPVVAFSVGEEELSGFDTKPLVGHLAAWNYFMSVESDVNGEFITNWHEFIKDQDRVTNDPMEAHYIGFNMWVKAVEAAGTTDPTAVQNAIIGVEVPNLSGGTSQMLANHHITKPVLIGEIQDDGQFATVWETDGLVPGDAWTDFLPESKILEADWTSKLGCGNYNTVTGKCSGQNF